MESKTSSELHPTHLPPTKPTTLLVSVQLTRSEVDALRQKKKLISAYAQKALLKYLKPAA